MIDITPTGFFLSFLLIIPLPYPQANLQ